MKVRYIIAATLAGLWTSYVYGDRLGGCMVIVAAYVLILLRRIEGQLGDLKGKVGPQSKRDILVPMADGSVRPLVEAFGRGIPCV